MKQSCYGWARDAEDMTDMIDMLLSENIQVVSVVNCEGGMSGMYVFGIAEEHSQIERVVETIKSSIYCPQHFWIRDR